MKKIISLLMIAVLCLGLVTMTGCGKDEPEDVALPTPFEGITLSDYVTLPDYDSFEVVAPEVVVSDDDINAALDEILLAMGTTESVTEGKVEKGDTIKVAYEGTLEDGTKTEGMKSDSQTVTLGSGNLIEGFEEGLYGATIGQTVTLNLHFPENYTINPDLSGKGVTFVVTVLSKEVTVPAEFNDKFVKDNSDLKNTEEYKARIAEMLEENGKEQAVNEKQYQLYEKISAESEVTEAIAANVTAEYEKTDRIYKKTAEEEGLEWDAFLEEYFQWNQEEYEKNLTEYCETLVKEYMIVYSIAEKEGVQVMQSEYDALVDATLLSFGVADEEEFEIVHGMSFDDYAEMYGLELNLVLDKAIKQIYGRIVK